LSEHSATGDLRDNYMKERHMICNSRVGQIVALNKLERFHGIVCVWILCQPHAASIGVVHAFSRQEARFAPRGWLDVEAAFS
jgi:hypothetical protein